MPKIRLLFLFSLLAACVHLPHVEPATRDAHAQTRTHVRVTSSCVDTDPFGGPGIVWGRGGTSSGVIISERHVLTAAHAVTCPVLPRVYVHLADGRKFRMVVDRDDAMFGSGRDVARLEIASAENFGLHVPPPKIDEPYGGSTVCLPAGCARLSVFDPTMVELPSRPGDSGRAVYDGSDALIGIVVRSNEVWTTIEPIGPYWLEGT